MRLGHHPSSTPHYAHHGKTILDAYALNVAAVLLGCLFVAFFVYWWVAAFVGVGCMVVIHRRTNSELKRLKEAQSVNGWIRHLDAATRLKFARSHTVSGMEAFLHHVKPI
jgi:hypothetical protein